MKVDVTQVLMGLDGEALKDGVDAYVCEKCGHRPESKDATVRSILMMCLLRNDPKMDGDKKYQNMRLAMRIQDNDEVELNAKEAADVGKLADWLPPAFVYRIREALDLAPKE